jgi:lipopolysaccharide/colanic/teichoic acid biosynthesis glycosyltransferase
MQHLYLSSDKEAILPPLLLIGFSTPVDHYVPDLPQDISTSNLNHTEAVFYFQSNLIESAPPQCIIFEYKSLEETDFVALRALGKSAIARQIPIIVLAEEEQINTQLLFRFNIDDCYRRPVYWQQLAARIDFLLMKKPEIMQSGNAAKAFDAYERVKVTPSKRIFDIVFAAGALLALSPLMIAVAILIRLESPGKIIYRSRRVGKNFDEFDFFKFRSMYQDADQRLKEMMAQNQYGENAVFVKFVNDPRITRVGRFIRKYSIDELPQLFNVLKGEMSLVGNRPLPVYEAEQLTTEDYSKRFFAPAGLTGLWQVTKRGTNEMSTAERIALDVQYANRNSMLYDAKLLMRTATAFVQKENV